MLHSPDSTSSIAHALDIADARHWTRQPPKSDRARLRFLQARHTSITALAAQLNTTPAALQNLLDHPQSPATQPTREAIAHDIIRMWQPRVRRRIHRQIINSQHAPVQVHLCAWFGFDAAAGSSDDGRQRRLTEALPAPYPQLLFEARHQGAGEPELRQILGEALAETYFHLRSPHKRSQVRLTDIAYVEFAY